MWGRGQTVSACLPKCSEGNLLALGGYRSAASTKGADWDFSGGLSRGCFSVTGRSGLLR